MNDEDRQRLKVLGAGILGLLLFLGIARFSYTPLLPLMREQAGLGVSAGGWLAAVNYLGYLVGALACAFYPPPPLQAARWGLAAVAVLTLAMGLPVGFAAWLLLRFAAIAILLIVVPFMLTALHTAWVVTKYERGGYKQPALLLDIVNPLAWLTRVEFDVNAVRLMVGLQANNKAELEAYLDWGQAFVRHTPRANIYANMVIALNALGRTAEADNLRASALMLYPGEPLLTVSAARKVAATLERKPSS